MTDANSIRADLARDLTRRSVEALVDAYLGSDRKLCRQSLVRCLPIERKGAMLHAIVVDVPGLFPHAVRDKDKISTVIHNLIEDHFPGEWVMAVELNGIPLSIAH